MVNELLTKVGFFVGASDGLRVGTLVEDDTEDVRDAHKRISTQHYKYSQHD